MSREKIYNATVNAKSFVFDFIEDKGLVSPEEVATLIIETNENWFMPVINKIAIINVLLSGTCFEDGGFNMPATSCCMENFNFTRKEVKKKKQLYLFVYDELERGNGKPLGDGYFSMPVY